MNLSLFGSPYREGRLLPDYGSSCAWHQPFRTFSAVDSLRRVPSVEVLSFSVLIQSGACAVWLDWPAVAAALSGIGGALFVWLLRQHRPGFQIPTWKHASARRSVIAMAAILLVICIVVMMFMRRGRAGEPMTRPRSSERQDMAHSRETAEVLGGAYRGVILLTEPLPHPVPVPPVPNRTRNLFSETLSRPLSIPFFGVYWMFRWPESQPPPGSFVSKRSPLTSEFHSIDRRPLSMEARQNFGNLIDLACCSRIQLAVRSADLVATLELVVANTTLPQRPSLSLGRSTISSTFDGRRDERPVPRQAVLSFDVPSRLSIREFDEATIRFNPTYATASARVAIDRFIFVPRGW